MSAKQIVSRKSRTSKHTHTPILRKCSFLDPVISVRFACGCRVELRDKQVTLILPKDPVTGNRKRNVGFIADGVLHIQRRGRDLLRIRGVYGISVHVLRSASTLGFSSVRCVTPLREGFIPTIDELLAQNPFAFRSQGYESQVGFTLRQIRRAA